MHTIQSKARGLALMAALSLAMAGSGMLACGSAGTTGGTTTGGNNNTNNGTTADPGTGTGDAKADTSSNISTSSASAGEGVSKALAANQPTMASELRANQSIQSLTYTCTPNGGEGTVTGDVTYNGLSTTFDLHDAFDNCNGLNGGLDIKGDVSFDLQNSSYTYNYSLTGSVGGFGCVVDYDNFGVSLQISGTTYAYQINGSLQSTCGDTSVTCNFNGVDATDSAALQAACQ